MARDDLDCIHPLELLDALREYPFLSHLNMAVYCTRKGVMGAVAQYGYPCAGGNVGPLCSTMCNLSHERGIKEALEKREPTIFSCASGFLNFAIPLTNFPTTESSCCLIAGGSHNKEAFPAAANESMADRGSMPLLALLENKPAHPSRNELEELATRVNKLLQAIKKKSVYSRILQKTMERLHAIALLSKEVDDCQTAEEVTSLLKELLAIVFNIRQAILALPTPTGVYQLQGLVGLEQDLGAVPEQQIQQLISSMKNEEACLLVGDETLPLPLAGSQATSIKLTTGDEIAGILFFPHIDLPPRDILCLQLFTAKAAAKMNYLRSFEDFKNQNSIAQQLMDMTSAISLAKNRRELHQLMLNMASELLQATSGSLMLIDEGRDTLYIEAVKGMSSHVARSMALKVGRGIAGKVVKTGNPLVVNNIETDGRTRVLNRPRFKTKSFISLPLKIQDQVIGVLNLADKKNEGIFTDRDLELLKTFTNQALLVLERAEFSERAAQLEELSVTDPLTGLYNRRLLEARMEEELNRSYRQKQLATVMLVDLDNFKIYNDICGHLAGDKVLKRVANLLSDSARAMDIVTRYGGEEFCLLLPGTSKRESMFVAERIRRAIESDIFPHEEHLPLGRLTASIGIASYPEDGLTSTSLLHSADIALYEAKEQGRNRIIMFEANGNINSGRIRQVQSTHQQV